MPATASTTRTDGTGRASALVWILPLAMGLIIMALATPRLYAYALLAAEGPGASEALRTGRPLAADALAEARAKHAEALAMLSGDDGIARDLGRLDLRARKGESGDEAMAAALAHLKAAAADAPNAAFNWTLLAYATQLAGGPRDDFLRYLRLSALTGPYEASSMLLRARMAFPLWNELPETAREDVARDLRRMWEDRRFRDRMMAFYLAEDYAARAIILEEAFPDERERRLFKRLLLRKLKLSGR